MSKNKPTNKSPIIKEKERFESIEEVFSDPDSLKEMKKMWNSQVEPKNNRTFPNKKYNIIYADPPWEYKQFQGQGKAYGDVSAHYPSMGYDELKTLPIDRICSDDCILFMWATYPNLPQAIKLIDAWGFEYKTVAFTWIKTRGGKYYSGIGFYTNSNCEICLIGIRGSFKRARNDIKQLVVSPLREHSRKPDEIRNRIVSLCGDLPRIELFTRQRHEGWDAWGNQLSDDIQRGLEGYVK